MCETISRKLCAQMNIFAKWQAGKKKVVNKKRSLRTGYWGLEGAGHLIGLVNTGESKSTCWLSNIDHN